jgi:hypothetical protein
LSKLKIDKHCVMQMERDASDAKSALDERRRARPGADERWG